MEDQEVFIGGGQTELQEEVSEGRFFEQFWLQDSWAGSPGAVTPPWCGCCHRQQRRRPLLQFPSQRSMWKQSLRQWPWLLLHCWLSERPLAPGERGQDTWLAELEPAAQSPKTYWGLHWCWRLSNGMLSVSIREIQLVPW